MSDDSGADVANDEEFFDQPSSRRNINETPAAERHGSLSVDDASAISPHHRSHRRGSSDDSNSARSSEGNRRTSVEEESRNRRTSSAGVKYAVVIPTPADNDEDHDQTDDSKRAEGSSTEHEEPDEEPPSRLKKKNKTPTGEHEKAKTVRVNRNHLNRNSPKGRMSANLRRGYSSDEEERHLEVARHSRRPVSSASDGQQLGTYIISRTRTPVRRPAQFRSASGFSNGSRMDVKNLLESLLQAENSRPRRKSVADPVEFRWRRNYTFSDKRLEVIERENKRLLDKIVAIHYSQPSYSRASQNAAALPDIARIKQLEKIEKENLVWLQCYIHVFGLRLKSVISGLITSYGNESYPL